MMKTLAIIVCSMLLMEANCFNNSLVISSRKSDSVIQIGGDTAWLPVNSASFAAGVQVSNDNKSVSAQLADVGITSPQLSLTSWSWQEILPTGSTIVGIEVIISKRSVNDGGDI